jgi:Bacterial Ig-like domain (group 3)/FG-GAP-like repeat
MTSPHVRRIKTSVPSASVLSLAVLTILVALAAPAIAQNPVPFVNQPLVPDATAPGGAGFTLTVNGAGFVAASTVNWNGTPRTTTFISSSKLTAAILSSDITTASTASVTVVSPSPGGGASNTQFFSIAVPETSVSFQPAVTYGSGGYISQAVRIADLNADGKLDIVVANWWDTNNVGVVGVLLGNGDGTFQPVVTYETDGAPDYSVAVADVNGDGKPDLIVTSCAASVDTCGSGNGVVSVLLGNGDGTFQPALSYSSGAAQVVHVAVADVNEDGKPDLIVTNYQGESNGDGTVGVLLGNGDGTFRPPVLYDSGAQNANMVTVADVNGDGALDLLVANRCDSCAGGGVLGVLLGNGNGTFQPVVTYATGGRNSAWVEVADLNGNGTLDAVVASLNLGTSEGSLSVMLGVGNGTFEPAVTYDSGGYAAVDAVIADVNSDGREDIVVANCGPVGNCGTGVIGVLLGRGDGTFDPVVTLSSGAYNATAIAVADLNGDGRPDLVAANQCAPSGCTTGSVAVLLNNSGAAAQCVGKCSTSTTLVSNLNPSVYGQPITFTATVTSTGGAPPNGETVTFYNGLNVLGTAPMTGGIAALTNSSMGSGMHTISAAYLGDANFTGSTSPVLEQAVDTSGQSATTTALTSSLNPSIYGQKVTWTVTVTTSGKTTPTGRVNFNWGSYSIGTATLNSSGVATLTRSNLSADAYPLFAEYLGDANNGPSASPILNQVITQATSSATLTSSPNPSTQGQSVTFTAKITSSTTTPTGPVTFTAGKTTLGTVELSNGKATFTTSTLAVGSTTVTVTYPTNSDIAGSSASVTQVVDQ